MTTPKSDTPRTPGIYCKRQLIEIDPDYLRALFTYNQETGALYWAKTESNRAIAGSVAGTISSNGYKSVSIGGRRFQVHRVIWAMHHGKWPSDAVDHINRIRSDNRIENLREATATQNAFNKGTHKNNTSGRKGVWLRKESGRWAAQITIFGKHRHIGYFKTKEEATQAREVAERVFFGEFTAS